MRRILVGGVFVLMGASACGENGGPTPPDPAMGAATNQGESGAQSGAGGSTDRTSASSAGSTAVDAAADEHMPAPTQALDRTIGPILLEPGDETTVCTTMRLGNTEPIFVSHMSVELAAGSHHLIVYRSAAPDENPTPTPCQPFQGIVGGGQVPLMLSQKREDELTFPNDVALRLDKEQMITVEAHYINTTSAELQGQGAVHFTAIPAISGEMIESDLAFWGPLSIHIPARQKASTPVLFQSAKAGTNGFAVSTHQHRLGTRFRIWYADDARDIQHPPVADNSDWSDPPLVRMDPVMTFNGNNGLAFQCEWENTTDQDVGFGESALQEMCFLWMYYYPSQGFDMRLLP